LDISPYDAIVVGSGATGGIAALTLAEQGDKSFSYRGRSSS